MLESAKILRTDFSSACQKIRRRDLKKKEVRQNIISRVKYMGNTANIQVKYQVEIGRN